MMWKIAYNYQIRKSPLNGNLNKKIIYTNRIVSIAMFDY